MAIFLVKSDIRDMHCDAIVTATDPELSGSRGIDKDIHEAAGPGLDEECRSIPTQEVGSAVITSGYNLSKYIIHTVPPVWNSEENQRDKVVQCYRNVFRLAKENHCATVAVPHIASGGFGFPPDEIIRIAISEARKILRTYNMDVFIITHRQSTFNMSTMMYEELLTRINDEKFSMTTQVGSSLHSLVNQPHETFRDMLARKISEKGMKNSDCYNKAFVTKSVFSKIMRDENYKPTKKTVASFALALELPIEEALDMFGKAGYYLTRNSKFDIIVEYCIENGIYDVDDVDDLLYKNIRDTLQN